MAKFRFKLFTGDDETNPPSDDIIGLKTETPFSVNWSPENGMVVLFLATPSKTTCIPATGIFFGTA